MTRISAFDRNGLNTAPLSLGVWGRSGDTVGCATDATTDPITVDAIKQGQFFKMGRIDISSSEIRDRVARGLPIRYLVPDEVCDLISEKGLYREGITR